MDMELFGVKGIYLIGSVETGEAGISSDIDLIVHVGNDEKQTAAMLEWFKGWNEKLALINLTFSNSAF